MKSFVGAMSRVVSDTPDHNVIEARNKPRAFLAEIRVMPMICASPSF
jgi:hypothetical protein